MGVPIVEKVILRAKGLTIFVWYKAVYGEAFRYVGIPKMRKGFTLQIERGGRVTLGEGVFFNNNCSISCRDSVTIGSETIFGEAVRIYDHNHRFNRRGIPVPEQGYTHAPVTIDKNCWIGSNVVILKGATIGDNCVIGAGCVVSGEIPPDSVCTAGRDLQISPVRYRDE